MKPLERIGLDGEWTLRQKNKEIEVMTHVPGSVFETLLEENLIEDPFYGINEKKMGWVYESNWIYEYNFQLDPSILDYPNIFIRFHGIDTIANVFLNGQKIGATEDMFITYEWDLKDILQAGDNQIKVVIQSPTREARREQEKHGYKFRNLMGIPGVAYLRKAQYSFGWDWGPQLPDMGIWKSVELIAFEGQMIESIYPVQTFHYNHDPLNITDPQEYASLIIEKADLQTKVELSAPNDLKLSADLTIRGELIDPIGNNIQREESPAKKDIETLTFSVKNPKLWWTHDLGTPHLYKLRVSLLDGEQIIDAQEIRFGIRDIQLVRDKDQWGETFYFRLNGIPVFAKGANWIPVDSFIPRGKRLGLYHKNLDFAKQANMNMIRVWGGGIYEDDLFYDICDEKGIMVWQDFPFACSVYPPNEAFNELVEKEAIQNIKRLRHRASLALWCGNNEIEYIYIGYIVISRIFSPFKYFRFKKAYKYRFEELLPKIVKNLDPQHDYWPSSPSNGGGKRGRGLFKSNSPDMGDSHFWKVWHRNAPFSAYREFDSRFMSEYGFESFPPMKTIRDFCPPEQFDFYSPIMENHQKNRAGNKKIMDYMEQRFSIPEEFEKQVVLSQITHAEAMEYGIEHWRRKRNDFHCMGSLYWQLNDCWPVASWASLDYYCRWKALHYVARRVYEPIFPSVKEETEKVEFWVTNDLRVHQAGIYIWKIYNSEGETLISGEKKVSINPCTSLLVETVDVSEINRREDSMRQNIVFYAFNVEGGDAKLQKGSRLFADPKDFPLQDPNLTVKIENISEVENSFDMVLKSEHIALYVYIESEEIDIISGDNYFSMEPCEERTIHIELRDGTHGDILLKKKNIEKNFKVQSLYDLIY